MNKPADNKQIIKVKSEVSDSDKVSDFFTSYVSAKGIDSEIKNDLRLAIEEAFVNISNYAFPDDTSHTITIEVTSDDSSIHITFIDEGITFNPLTHCNNEIECSDHCEGGMGIHLIKSLTDRQEYKRIGQQNVFTVTKHYTK
jgi:sigma-B regulation protein RsbU (phosphoserine phosphatase)